MTGDEPVRLGGDRVQAPAMVALPLGPCGSCAFTQVSERLPMGLVILWLAEMDRPGSDQGCYANRAADSSAGIDLQALIGERLAAGFFAAVLDSPLPALYRPVAETGTPENEPRGSWGAPPWWRPCAVTHPTASSCAT